VVGDQDRQDQIGRLVRIDWQTVGRIIERVADVQLEERRLDGHFDIGIDEIAWHGGHRYLTLVTDHRRGKIVWGAEGRSAAVADRFFADLDPPAPAAPSHAEATSAPAPAPAIAEPASDQASVGPRAAKLQAISMDMGPGYAKSARRHAPQAVICIDPYHKKSTHDFTYNDPRRATYHEALPVLGPAAPRRRSMCRASFFGRLAPRRLSISRARCAARGNLADGFAASISRRYRRTCSGMELPPLSMTAAEMQLCRPTRWVRRFASETPTL